MRVINSLKRIADVPSAFRNRQVKLLNIGKMDVLWKSIPGYEGIYEVSNTGLIRGRNGERKTLINSHGYEYIKLCKKGDSKKFQVHRLVAMAFIPNPDNLPEVNHKDENPLNNCVDNLEWCTRIYNNNYGTRNYRAGVAISKANRMKVYRFDKNGNYLDSFDCAETAEKYIGKKIRTAIGRCARGERKSAGGFIWKYAARGKPE